MTFPARRKVRTSCTGDAKVRQTKIRRARSNFNCVQVFSKSSVPLSRIKLATSFEPARHCKDSAIGPKFLQLFGAGNSDVWERF